MLNRHSVLRGNDPAVVNGSLARGQRVFCSDRGQRGGCGKTFPLFFAEVLPRHTFPASLLWALLRALLPARRSEPPPKRCACRFRRRRLTALSGVCDADWMECEAGSAASGHHHPLAEPILCSRRSVICKPSSRATPALSPRTSGIFSKRFLAKHRLEPNADVKPVDFPPVSTARQLL